MLSFECNWLQNYKKISKNTIEDEKLAIENTYSSLYSF